MPARWHGEYPSQGEIVPLHHRQHTSAGGHPRRRQTASPIDVSLTVPSPPQPYSIGLRQAAAPNSSACQGSL